MKLYRPKFTDPKTGKRRLARKYWCDFTVKGRRHRVPTGMTDRRAADSVARQLVEEAENLSVNRKVAAYEKTAGAALPALVAEYVRELARQGLSAKHVAGVRRDIESLLGEAERLSELTPEYVRTMLARIHGRKAPRTQNRVRGSLGALFRWLAEEGRWAENPVDRVKRVREIEPTRRRRPLTEEEVGALLQASPPQRAAVYYFALVTGFRRGEVAKVLWSGVDLDGRTVYLDASSTKGKRPAQQEIPADAVSLLRRWREGAPGAGLQDRVFPRMPTAREVRGDFDAAGIEAETPEGRADFQALRATYGTRLVERGVSLPVAQRLLRHKDPRVTLAFYVRARPTSIQAAVESLGFSSESLCRVLCRDHALSLHPAASPRHTEAQATKGVEGSAGPANAAPPRKTAGGGMEAPCGIEPQCADLQSAA